MPGSESDDFKNNFPKLFLFDLYVTEFDLSGWDEEYRRHGFNMAHPPPSRIACTNRLCRRGGLDLERILSRVHLEGATEIDETMRCEGDEGSPKGRRKGKSCHHAFRIKGKFTFIE